MANEILVSYQSAKVVYFLIYNRTGSVWNVTNSAFEAYVTATFSQYKISATEQGTASKVYAGSFPTIIPAGVYGVSIREQLTGSPLETDPIIAGGDYQWNGVATFPLSDLATNQLGQLRPAYGVMIKPFMFKMVSSADHSTPFTSGVISGQISRDSGNFGVLQSGAYSEVGLGWFSLQALTSGDMQGKNIALVFTGNGISGGTADQRDFSFLTQRVSGIS